MGVLARWFLAFALILGATPIRAQEYLPDDSSEEAWQDATDDADAAPEALPAGYQDALDPYGQWVDDATYGQVWRPAVAYGWRPYVDGYWGWSPYGWTWVSSEPWAWTLHYGRWWFDPTVGWVWVPGSVWGPAWVDWFWGDGFVGWAPLSPFVTQVTVIDQFVFVHADDFCHPHLATVVVDHRLVPDPVIHGWEHRDFRPPPRDQIERVAHRQPVRFEGKPPNSFLPAGARLARPELHPRRATALGEPRPAPGEGRLASTFATQVRQPGPARELARPMVRPGLGGVRAPGSARFSVGYVQPRPARRPLPGPPSRAAAHGQRPRPDAGGRPGVR